MHFLTLESWVLTSKPVTLMILSDIPEVRVFTVFRVFTYREINCFLVLVFITNFDQFFLKFFTREARKKLVVVWCFWVHFEVHARSNNSETACVLFGWSAKCLATYMIKTLGIIALVKIYSVVHSFVALEDAKLAFCVLEKVSKRFVAGF